MVSEIFGFLSCFEEIYVGKCEGISGNVRCPKKASRAFVFYGKLGHLAGPIVEKAGKTEKAKKYFGKC